MSTRHVAMHLRYMRGVLFGCLGLFGVGLLSRACFYGRTPIHLWLCIGNLYIDILMYVRMHAPACARHVFLMTTSHLLLLLVHIDIRLVNSESVYAKKTGMIILGGGVVKHHICNSNLMVCLGPATTDQAHGIQYP